MGRQLSFCLTPGDTEELRATLIALNSFTALSPTARTATPEVLGARLGVQRMGEEPLLVLVARDEDVDDITMRPVNPSLWRIDSITEPVLEFSRPFFAGRAMRPGRLFFETGYYLDGAWRDKKPAFLDWSRSVFELVRRTLKRDATGIYWGSEASELRAKSKLSLVDDLRPPPT